MNTINNIFEDIADFIKYVPGVSANIEFSELNSSSIAAKKQIINMITNPVWNSIISEPEDAPSILALKSAFANLIMHKYLIFDVVAKRMSGTADVYKHEIETMRRQYFDNYFNSMDTLIEILSTEEKYEVWKQTPSYKQIDSLRIKTTAELNSFYGIDMSYLFFFRTITLQQEILLDGLEDVFLRAEGREKQLKNLKLALAQLIIALALSRFDIIELPLTIRSLFDEQKASRSGDGEQKRILSLAAELRGNAQSIISAVEIALTNPEETNIITDTSFNKESDKIYLIS